VKTTTKLACVVVAVVVVFALVLVNPTSALVLEISYTVSPVVVGYRGLHDVELDFRIDRFYESMPTYQLVGGYSVASGSNKLSLFDDVGFNFTLDASIYKDSVNGSLWRSVHFVFSTVAERKISIYLGKPSNVTMGSVAYLILDAHLVAWREGATIIDKTLHKTFTVDIPTKT